MNDFERLEEIHNTIKLFFKKLENIESVSHDDGMDILKEANTIVGLFNGAYGEYTYLYEACARHFDEMYKDFWDRVEGK